jgi:8-oxo-dGTP pyrophosphatase MutT (NUDIX family)
MLLFTLIALAVSAYADPTATPVRAGVILHHPNGTVLCVKSALSGRWSFTKGHREPFDADFRATAVREVFEEVGYREGTHYTFMPAPSTVYGRSHYWQGITTPLLTQVPRLNASEHSAAAWLAPRELRGRRTTPDIKDWLKLEQCHRQVKPVPLAPE